MATRPIYQSIQNFPFYKLSNIDFPFHSGFSIIQKQKSIKSLHEKYLNQFKDAKLLEISSKSTSKLGIDLSAFNLYIHTTKRKFSVECAFQSSKIFEKGGPYIDLLSKTSKEAKRDIRIKNSGKLIKFKYFDCEFPLEPKDFFYNWLYINALYLNQNLATEITRYDSFSDIEFNPKKSINCQAKAAAIFVSLSKQNLLSTSIKSHEEFLKIVYNTTIPVENNQLHLEL